MLPESENSEEVVLAARPGGLVVQGSPSAIERFANQVSTVLGSSAVGGALAAVESIKAVVGSLPSTGGGGQQLFEFSPRAMELLSQHNTLPAGDGFFRSMVHDGQHFAGNLDWKPVTSPVDLAQLQTAAAGLALQAAIKNLADAVARVEVKVDVLADLVRSDQFGDVLGQHRVLQRLLDMTADGAALGSTDWLSIDQMRIDITSSLERTRMFIRSRVEAAESGWLTRARADAAEQLLESGLVDTLGILSVCEQNLAGWHHLRLLRVQQAEPDQVDAVVRDIEGDLAAHRADDEALALHLVELLNGLADTTGFEGFEPLKSRKLKRSIEELKEATERFVDERNLGVEFDEHNELPGTVESLRLARDRAAEGSKWAVGSARKLLRRGRKSSEVAEIEASDE